MQITELHPPINGGTLYYGSAKSTRGRPYQFFADCAGNPGPGVFREEPQSALPDGRTFWLNVPTPRALQASVRQAVRGARRKRTA
jgi:hypothetical protein